jgi:hypothetical protein
VRALLVFLLLLAMLAPTPASADISISGGVEGTDWRWDGDVLTIMQNGTYTISGSGQRVFVQGGLSVDITLDNVNIGGPGSPFDIGDGATVYLTLSGVNALGGVDNRVMYDVAYAGLHVPPGATLIINGGGSLTARGANAYFDDWIFAGAAGIGGNGGINVGSPYNDAGTIIINGGTIEAYGGNKANYYQDKGEGAGAGIGGGGKGAVSEITIHGGTITAQGGSNEDWPDGHDWDVHNVAIGHGYGATTTNPLVVTITGGNVVATSYKSRPSNIVGGNNIGGGTQSTLALGGDVSVDATVTVANIALAGNVTLHGSLTIPEGCTWLGSLHSPESSGGALTRSLTIAGDATLTNNGTIKVYPRYTLNGAIATGSERVYYSPTISLPSTITGGKVREPYSPLTFNATGDTWIEWTWDVLPAGLTLSPVGSGASATVSGTPTETSDGFHLTATKQRVSRHGLRAA